MDELLWGLVGFLLAMVGALSVQLWSLRATARPPASPAEDGETDDMADNILALQRQVKLVQGRLNAVAPPRAGTGAIAPPEATQAPSERSRSEVLAEYRRRRTS